LEQPLTGTKRSSAEVPPSHAALEAGRAHYQRGRWRDAHASLLRADRHAPLGADDLERLALCAYLVGNDDDYLAALERAHAAHLQAGDPLRAARSAFWLGFRAYFRGETGCATGWFARAQRLVDRTGDECVEHGYVLIAVAQRHADAGDFDTAFALAGRAAEIGERYGEADLAACGRHIQGRVRLHQARIAEGLALLDEAMVAVIAGELSSPVMTGLIYCSVIEGCREVYAIERAREWTDALARWCQTQPDMVAFTGVCAVHRVEILQLQGAWADAHTEARRACTRCALAAHIRVTAAAHYQHAEVCRLLGDFAAAEEGYREASGMGFPPQPGLALMRAAQGRLDAAAAGIRSALGATTGVTARARLLPAHVEIMLLAGDVEAARAAQRELAQIARTFGTDVLHALALQAQGEIALATGDAGAALAALREALRIWLRVDAPYQAARTRVATALACRAVGDADGGDLELAAARTTFTRLGARPDLARLDALAQPARARAGCPLSPRELQVLRLVAAGRTNKAIAAELHLSEKTVDRHVSNILTKLDVPSRAAATARGYETGLI
jgi:ATP/maltotriose-dependent transcriptional regulator MalT